MTKFEVGKTYSFERFCSEDGTLTFSVILRTEKTVVIDYLGEQNRRKIHTDRDGEYILPIGSYPYAPIGHSKNEEPEEVAMTELETALEDKVEKMTAEKVKSLIATKPEEVMEKVWSLTSNDVRNVAKELEISEAENDGIREILNKIADKILFLQEAIEEIRRLTTEEEIKSVLINCTEVDVCVIGEEFTGDKWVFQPEYITRECLIKLVARSIAYSFSRNAFSSLTAEEQVAELLKMEPDEIGRNLALCETEQDVYAIAVALGLDVGDYTSYYYIVEAIKQSIRVMQAVKATHDFDLSEWYNAYHGDVINGKTYVAFADKRDDKRHYMQNYGKVPKVLQP